MLKKLFFVLSIMFIGLGQNESQASPIETYQFQDAVTKVRFQALTKELRCPKCQNQNLADSNSPIAADLRREIYDLLQQGKADSEVINYMVDRYGEFVLYRPKVSRLTYILWFGPAVLIFIGAIIVIVIIRKKPVSEKEIALDKSQQAKLEQILSGSSDDTSSMSTHQSSKK